MKNTYIKLEISLHYSIPSTIEPDIAASFYSSSTSEDSFQTVNIQETTPKNKEGNHEDIGESIFHLDAFGRVNEKRVLYIKNKNIEELIKQEIIDEDTPGLFNNDYVSVAIKNLQTQLVYVLTTQGSIHGSILLTVNDNKMHLKIDNNQDLISAMTHIHKAVLGIKQPHSNFILRAFNIACEDNLAAIGLFALGAATGAVAALNFRS